VIKDLMRAWGVKLDRMDGHLIVCIFVTQHVLGGKIKQRLFKEGCENPPAANARARLTPAQPSGSESRVS